MPPERVFVFDDGPTLGWQILDVPDPAGRVECDTETTYFEYVLAASASSSKGRDEAIEQIACTVEAAAGVLSIPHDAGHLEAVVADLMEQASALRALPPAPSVSQQETGERVVSVDFIDRVDRALSKTITTAVAIADDTPYRDDSRWSPWTRWWQPVVKRCSDVRDELRAIRSASVPSRQKGGGDVSAATNPHGYEIIVAPYSGPRSGGPWLVRCYDGTGQHVHSAEGGVSLNGGLREVERAIEDDQQERLACADEPEATDA